VNAPWPDYTAPYRIRFDEAGPDGRIRTSVLLRYAQDVAWLHSISRGFGRDWYRERGVNWVVRAVDLEVLSPIGLGDTLEATTHVVGHRRVWARRQAAFRSDGRLVARVRTDWLLIDGGGRPVRLPAEFDGAFELIHASEGIGRVRLPPPPPAAVHRTIDVRPHELDPMAHVNNAVYVDWLEESLLEAGAGSELIRYLPRRAQIEYAAAAPNGARIDACSWPVEGGWAHRLGLATGEEVLRAILGPIPAAAR
jgi:acyl-ACP thioesterase